MTLSRQPIVRIALCLVMGLTLANCGGVPYYDQVYNEYGDPKGVYHPVKKGQTLYSIAKAYGISAEELQRINGIRDPSDMDVGHHLWIPDRDRVVYVAPTVDRAPGVSQPPVSPKKKSIAKRKPAPSRKKSKSATAKRKLMWPVRGGVLTSRFGTRGGKNHHGIDIGARRGTPIRAAGPGTVKFSGWGPTGYGLMVIIKHPGNLTTVYAHNSRNLVKKGSKVKRGQMIARVGKTGRASGPHVHFEVRNDTHPKNPLLYVSKK
jgi:murein DD-endopeptidase MepM/ murein hydrolase activator NlpD